MPPSRTQRQRRRQPYNCTEINIINNAELCTNTQNILTFIQESRPKNTTLAYNPKQESLR
jgi:hypothetical protein